MWRTTDFIQDDVCNSVLIRTKQFVLVPSLCSVHKDSKHFRNSNHAWMVR